ncbi:MAG TPA: CehA/McbA family metallohydrolase [Vicinamibacterales bacterium]|nr:CehA/McbA family metallohydrolase [Vicinamibacterales bacterium]
MAGMALILTSAAALTTLLAGPSRFGFSDRVERHLFPEVTTGPAEPVWSPDGKWMAFSMQGDIWKVPVEGGEATAITKGPWYYFEPAWSPDGSQIAFTVDTGGNLDLGVVSANGGEVQRLTEDRAVDLEPAWARDGRAIYFISSRNRGFDIFKLDVATRAVTGAVTGGGDQLQPAISPDGRTIAYVAPVSGRVGTGGIWTRPIDGPGEPTLVHYEESEYRMRPAWTPDGKAIVFGSDERGSNDIAIVAADGGNPMVITNDRMGEFSGTVSPDGKSIAFISNRTGPMTLYTAPIGGGPISSWRRVGISSRRAATPTGRLRGRIVDEKGQTMPGRVQLVASDTRAYAPDDGFARVMAVTETHYFHTSGEFEVEVPAGQTEITVLRGFERNPMRSAVDIRSGQTTTVTLSLNRLVDMPAQGWYSGDTHAHDLHQGRFGLTHPTLFAQSLGEDLHVTNVLIHMDGTRLMGRWEDLTGEPSPLSTRTHVMQFSEEFRGSLGHIGMLGLKTFILPLVGGANNTPYEQVASDTPYHDGARAQGGIAGFMHPYTSSSPEPGGWAGSLIPVDVALGKGDFYDVASLYSDEMASAEMYYRLLNSGFRIPATGGTDNFPDVWRDPPPGTDRTYAKVDGTLTLQSWMAAVKAGRTFATTGPLLLLDVEGKAPGDELRLAANRGDKVRVNVRVISIAPVGGIEILVNGVVQTPVLDPTSHVVDRPYQREVSIPDGGWIAARVRGPASPYLGDSIAFAQTSPVYVVREGKPPFVNAEDAKFLAGVVDAIWARASRSQWRSDADREAFKAEIDRAKAVYLKIAGS